MKTITKTFRLTSEENKILKEKASIAQMTDSEYLRSLINSSAPHEFTSNQPLITSICRIHVILSELGLDENEALMKEVNRLCQILS